MSLPEGKLFAHLGSADSEALHPATLFVLRHGSIVRDEATGERYMLIVSGLSLFKFRRIGG